MEVSFYLSHEDSSEFESTFQVSNSQHSHFFATALLHCKTVLRWAYILFTWSVIQMKTLDNVMAMTNTCNHLPGFYEIVSFER